MKFIAFSLTALASMAAVSAAPPNVPAASPTPTVCRRKVLWKLGVALDKDNTRFPFNRRKAPDDFNRNVFGGVPGKFELVGNTAKDGKRGEEGALVKDKGDIGFGKGEQLNLEFDGEYARGLCVALYTPGAKPKQFHAKIKSSSSGPCSFPRCHPPGCSLGRIYREPADPEGPEEEPADSEGPEEKPADPEGPEEKSADPEGPDVPVDPSVKYKVYFEDPELEKRVYIHDHKNRYPSDDPTIEATRIFDGGPGNARVFDYKNGHLLFMDEGREFFLTVQENFFAVIGTLVPHSFRLDGNKVVGFDIYGKELYGLYQVYLNGRACDARCDDERETCPGACLYSHRHVCMGLCRPGGLYVE